MAKAKPHPALPLLLRDGAAALTPAAVSDLFAYVDAAGRVQADPRDSAHDKLFAAIMARADLLQAQRDGWLRAIDRIRRTPPLWPLVLQQACKGAAMLLADAGLLADDARRHLQVTGLMAVMAATFHAWQTDTSTDLSATLRACDTNLRRGATAMAWLGFV